MKTSLKELFHNWNDLNKQVEDLFGKFDFTKIKGLRNEQKKIEDQIFEILLENASSDLKKVLPETCGDMEVGFDTKNEMFYYLMYDPYHEESSKIFAVTIDLSGQVDCIEDFKYDDEN